MVVEFRLLGDIQAYVDSRQVAIGYAQLRCTLAVLLVEANRTVSVDDLVEHIWGTRPLPSRPRNAVQHSMTMLRRALSPAAGVTITRQSSGYQLAVDPATVDVHRFRSLVDEARAVRDDDDAADLYEQALALWRGEPFAGHDVPWLNSVRATLSTEHRAARLDLTDVQLRRGRHAALLVELSEQVERHTLDERLTGQYLIALYRSGRQSAALEHYQRVRSRLIEQLGTDPSPPLRELYQQILTADAGLAAPAASPVVTTIGTPTPRQLPAAPQWFVGRANELALLDDALDAEATRGRTVVISAIAGIGGIGKTWLALHWAYQHLDRFPDGQLYLDLRGYAPTADPLAPADAIRGLLAALGVQRDRQPSEWDAQVGLYRSLLADRRMLIVLDNARDASQVTPLLPGSATCTVLITSRHRLAGLVTTHGALPLPLDVLTKHEAYLLLTRRIGRDRVIAEREAVDGLLANCAGLPLALGIVAARANKHPDFPLATLADELDGEANRLDALDDGDLTANLRAVLSWSHHPMSGPVASTFWLVGLAPGPDIGLPAAAALTGLPIGRVRMLLRELENVSLVQEHVQGRYRMHDLIRLYAKEQALRDCPEPVRTNALRRLVGFYVHTAYAGERLLYPQVVPIEIGDPPAGCQPHPLRDDDAALEWFTAEHVNLLACQRFAARRGWHTPVWQLAYALKTFHARQGRMQEVLATARAGLAAAELLGDPGVQAMAHRLVGGACAYFGLLTESIDHLGQSLNYAERTGNVLSQVRDHHVLAGAWEEYGDCDKALEHATHALQLARRLGGPVLEGRELNAVGWYLALLGRYEQARVHCAAALTLLRPHTKDGEAATLDSLGYIDTRTGHYAQAVTQFQLALVLRRTRGDSYQVANTLEHLGEAQAALGQHDDARQSWQEALELHQEQHRDADATRIQRQLAGLDRS